MNTHALTLRYKTNQDRQAGLLINILRRSIQLPIHHAGVDNPLDIICQPCTPNTLLSIAT